METTMFPVTSYIFKKYIIIYELRNRAMIIGSLQKDIKSKLSIQATKFAERFFIKLINKSYYPKRFSFSFFGNHKKLLWVIIEF